MSKKEEYEKKSEALIMPIVEQHQFELVDVEYVKEGSNWYLRAYIDKPGGITIDDCELVSRAFEAELDRVNLIPDAYILEVSSPGLGRPLKKDKDFARSIGEEVEVHLFRAVEKQKEFVGLLRAYDADAITIEFPDETAREFKRSDISLVRLTFDF